MDIFSRPLASLLAFFFQLVPNYAVAIGLLTITVMIVLLPLTLKGTRSMLAMQRLAPEIKKLQDKHKNDRQKLNEEVMAVYRDNKINPLGGCLPLLLQLPVFFVLYTVINGLTARNKEGLITPKFLDADSELFQRLREDAGTMVSFGVDLAKSATDSHGSFVAGMPFYALLVIMVLAQYYQQRQMTNNAPPSADTPQAQQLKMFQKFYPPFFGLISLGFPAALVLYWVISSLFRIVQQWAMYRFCLLYTSPSPRDS